MYSGTVSGSTAIATTAVTQTIEGDDEHRAHAERPISRLVSGPAIAWPMDVAARTSPAAPYEPVCCSTCSRNASESMPDGKRAVSWAAMMRATPEVLSSSE